MIDDVIYNIFILYTICIPKYKLYDAYWEFENLYRYNPQLKEEGKNPFSLDSKEPTENFQDFLKGEVRYASLAKAAPDVAEELFAKTEQDAKDRRLSYVRLQKGFEDVK